MITNQMLYYFLVLNMYHVGVFVIRHFLYFVTTAGRKDKQNVGPVIDTVHLVEAIHMSFLSAYSPHCVCMHNSCSHNALHDLHKHLHVCHHHCTSDHKRLKLAQCAVSQGHCPLQSGYDEEGQLCSCMLFHPVSVALQVSDIQFCICA